jgi:hypothetical protein
MGLASAVGAKATVQGRCFLDVVILSGRD